MKKLKFKVCGMRDPKNILEIAELHPDFMGFIFYEQSKRFVGNNFRIPSGFPESIKRVGVFVNEGVDRILQVVKLHRLDFVQLHGDETVQVVNELKEKVRVIKVFRVNDQFDFNVTKEFEGIADFFMFDTKTSEYGGSGKSFDWNLLEKYKQSTPFFLSGGLGVNNIKQTTQIKNSNFFALDINSGAETSPGVKDPVILHSIFQILNSSRHEIHS
jgi:phosphoribosylanthranilate isomerase